MGETCCLRLMQADGMNDNLSGNPAMPPPTGTTVQDREGITGRHPSAHPAAGMGITAATPVPSPQQECKSQAGTPLPTPQQEWKSQAGPPLPASNNNRYRQTAVKAALAIFLLYKGLSLISTDRTPPKAAWRHERG